MRPWIIVLSSAILALVAAVAVIWPELTVTPHTAMLSNLKPLVPSVAVVALAAYGLCAILLTSGDLIEGALRVRWHLARNPPHHGPAWPDWTAAFDRNGFRRLVPPRAAVQPNPAPADGTVVLRGPFEPREARREVARLFYIGAARAHFFSAVIVLAAIVVLGAAQPYSRLSFIPGPIPTVPAGLAVAGLVLLAFLARVAVDVAAEPLIELISRLPAETTEAGLLRRTAELLATPTTVNPPNTAPAPVAAVQIPERLGEILEQGHRALFDAIEHLSATTDGLATTTRSSIEALEAAFRATELREQTYAQHAVLDTAAMTDLRDAVAALTGILQSIRSMPAAAEDDLAPSLPRTDRQPDLALELRKLLKDLETAP